MKTKIQECPYCYSERVRLADEESEIYLCESCECLFNQTDVEIEDIRHELYHFLALNKEGNPYPCDIQLDDEYCVVSCFSCEDGTLWFNLRGETEPRDFDYFAVELMRKILIGLQSTIPQADMNTEKFLQKWFGLEGRLWQSRPCEDGTYDLTEEGDLAWKRATELLEDLRTMGAYDFDTMMKICHTLCDNS